jgi:hypothetical protein
MKEWEECPLCGPDCICEEVESQYGCMQTEGVVLTNDGPLFVSELSNNEDDQDDEDNK